MLHLVENFYSLFAGTHQNRREVIFDAGDYHPLYGQPGKVDHPKIRINTFWPTPPNLDRVAGDLDRHPISSPLYQQAWERRKKESYYENPIRYQLGPDVQPPIIGKELIFLGNKRTSRDRAGQTRPHLFYATTQNERMPLRDRRPYGGQLISSS